jgi:hypothetical protein
MRHRRTYKIVKLHPFARVLMPCIPNQAGRTITISVSTIKETKALKDPRPHLTTGESIDAYNFNGMNAMICTNRLSHVFVPTS